jgi:hypothetical protein
MYPLSTLLRGCWTEINLHLRLKLSFLRYKFILRKYSFLNNNNNNIIFIPSTHLWEMGNFYFSNGNLLFLIDSVKVFFLIVN